MAFVDQFVASVSGKRQLLDQVSPHKLAVLCLIKEYCRVKNQLRTPADNPDPVDFEVEHWFTGSQQIRTFSITVLGLLQSPDKPLSKLIEITRGIFHVKMMTSFLDGLREMHRDGVAAIMNMMQSLEFLLADPRANTTPLIQKSSVIGFFLRRMMLAFDKLTFDQVVKLSDRYKSYYISAEVVDENSMDLDISVAKLNIENESELDVHVSNKQAELFISRQAAIFYGSDGKSLPTQQLQQNITKFLAGNAELPEGHFLSYLNCLRAREFCGAIHSLYRCFDKSLGVGAFPEQGKVEEMGKSFRYAALNLAGLLARFGYVDEAKEAINESIAMAQEANDNVCLQHALTWLSQLDPDRKDKLLGKLIGKTNELNLSYLLSLGIQSLASAKSLSEVTPSAMFQFLIKSDVINCEHGLTDLNANSYSMKVALWNLYGKQSMALASDQLLLFLSTPNHLYKGCYDENVCVALCDLAGYFSKKGDFDIAIKILNFVKELHPLYTQNACKWQLYEQLCFFEKYLYDGKFDLAEEAASKIRVWNENEANLRLAEVELYRGNGKAACELVNSLLSESPDITTDFEVRLLVLKSDIFVAATNFGQAICDLNKAATISQKCHLDYLEGWVLMHIGNVQMHMGLLNQAQTLIERNITKMLISSSWLDVGRAWLVYCKCKLALLEREAVMFQEGYEEVIGLLSGAQSIFEKVEAGLFSQDVLYLLARLSHLLGRREERNNFAMRFNQVQAKVNWVKRPDGLL